MDNFNSKPWVDTPLVTPSTRVFYWGANGELNYGTVQSTNRMADVHKGFGSIGPLLTNCHAGHADRSHSRGQWQVYESKMRCSASLRSMVLLSFFRCAHTVGHTIRCSNSMSVYSCGQTKPSNIL